MNKPLVVLAIIDGFGYSPQTIGNAIYQAQTPNLDKLWSQYPHYLLKAAEEEVGLGFGEVGNSEVGHISLGTGRVIPQSLSLINKSIEDNTFFSNQAFQEAIETVQTHNSNLHIYGIISTAGVHGHLNHYIQVLRLAAKHKLKKVFLHLILDGRDAGPKDSPLFLREIDLAMQQTTTGTYASLCGRGLAMDRNNNWERIIQAYNVLFGEAPHQFATPQQAVDHFYNQNIDDENIPPTLICNPDQPPVSIQNHDAIIITNYREDRARQITKALCLQGFNKFPRPKHPKELNIVTMTSYEADLPVKVAFPPPQVINTLSDVLSSNQISQIHIGETEKYAHVTYFFNGGRESKAPLEEFFLIPSLKPEEFEHNPQMSAFQITQAVIQSIDLGYQFIIFNFANCDMVGHTGNYQSTVQAVNIIDQQFGLIQQAVFAKNGYLLITADHGNAEQKINPQTGGMYKEHTISPVPFIISHPQLLIPDEPIIKITTNSNVAGLLSDVAPTILSIFNIPSPSEMTGTTLFEEF